MKKIIFLFFSVILFAQKINLSDKSIPFLLKNHYYTYLCLNRWKYINRYAGKREDLLSLVAYACLKKHYLTYALDLAKELRYTKIGRENSTYIISLFAIKNFLMRYIEDGLDISKISFPIIKNDDLGKVFVLTKKIKPKVNNNSYTLYYKGNKIVVNYNIQANQIIISFFDNKKLIKKEKYW